MGSPIDEKIRESHQRQFDYIQWRGINAIILKKKSELIQVDGQQKRKQMKTKDNISINN